MTGEVSLHGSVEAVGGIAQKIVAAAHHQRRTDPAANAADLRDVPDDVLGKIEIITVERMEEVLQYALLPAPRGARGPELTSWRADSETSAYPSTLTSHARDRDIQEARAVVHRQLRRWATCDTAM